MDSLLRVPARTGWNACMEEGMEFQPSDYQPSFVAHGKDRSPIGRRLAACRLVLGFIGALCL